MADLPNLAGIATAELVEKIGGGNFQASYINWSRTLHLLRTHAPGWLPELVTSTDGGILHTAPVGAFLLIRFRHTDGTVTPEVPQAVMDTRNAAIALTKVTARDITDTHRRGVCMAAALTFGLAYELWAKVALESGYSQDDAHSQENDNPHPEPQQIGRPTDGAWDGFNEEECAFIEKCGAAAIDLYTAEGVESARAYIEGLNLASEEKIALWTLLPSHMRTALKKAKKPAEDIA